MSTGQGGLSIKNTGKMDKPSYSKKGLLREERKQLRNEKPFTCLPPRTWGNLTDRRREKKKDAQQKTGERILGVRGGSVHLKNWYHWISCSSGGKEDAAIFV